MEVQGLVSGCREGILTSSRHCFKGIVLFTCFFKCLLILKSSLM
ncbi:hypothetical protein Patl1_05689 [Pistacia atlantica]|uniref:Uncharacterized protein n=1 Tax=Pistacia atlantica TaxID=434234 RepID=A0ACC1BW27_9ROSI|nr:hypothetical protein Patl1_05689 [Pistacia atlantica]